MLAYERAAGGERAACGGGIEWTPEGDRKGMQILSMGDGEKTSLTNDAYVGTQWVGRGDSAKPGGTARDKLMLIWYDMLLSQQNYFAGTGVFLVGNAAVLPSPAGMFYTTVQRKENYRNE